MNAFFSLPTFDYRALEKELLNANLPAHLKKNLEEMIANYKAIIQFRETIVKLQEDTQEGLFGFTLSKLLQEKNIESKEESSFKNKDISSDNTSPENETDSKNQESSEEIKPNKRKKKNKLPSGNIVKNSLTAAEKTCTSCGKSMHKQRPKVRTYVLAIPMLQTETHLSNSCRCLYCGTSASAQSENKIAENCIGNYHYSAVASLASLRYQFGMPSFRLEQMSSSVGIKVSDSTQWYLFEKTATLLKPFVTYLVKKVANAPVNQLDDTSTLVLEIAKNIENEKQIALQNGKSEDSVRSGIHTTNLTAVFPEGKIVLYKTGLHHAGEVLAKILSARTTEEKLIVMADASSVNTSKIHDKKNVLIANCNSHAFRKFKDIAKSENDLAKKFNIKDFKTSDEVDFFLTHYRKIFENDKKTKSLSLKNRLEYHKKNSYWVMEEMKIKVEFLFHNRKVEPNSDLGKTYKYFLKHYSKLIAFCHFEGAPVCNNLSERLLKAIIRHRKNSLFFKTQLGAHVADIFTTLLFTAWFNEINSIEYVTNLLKYKNIWSQNPECFLPWNYVETIQRLSSQN